MTMTKKDFEAIAAKFAELRSEYSQASIKAANEARYDDEDMADHIIAGIDLAAYRICEAFGATNPRFDRFKFLQAAGVVR